MLTAIDYYLMMLLNICLCMQYAVYGAAERRAHCKYPLVLTHNGFINGAGYISLCQ